MKNQKTKAFFSVLAAVLILLAASGVWYYQYKSTEEIAALQNQKSAELQGILQKLEIQQKNNVELQQKIASAAESAKASGEVSEELSAEKRKSLEAQIALWEARINALTSQTQKQE